MSANEILQVILEQQEELSYIIEDNYVYRQEADEINLNSKLAQVVIGVRRSGKSTLCHLALRKAGINYGYVNFDDDRLAFLSVEDLNRVLEGIYRVYGTDIKHIFFDEIQDVDGWHLFVSRLLRQGMHIIVTGSNAKLLSSELSTHLTGRYNEIKLFPFSFKDFCAFRKIKVDKPTTKQVAILKNTLDTFLKEGGFPELSSISNKHTYVGGLIDAIISKDIMRRFHIRNGNGLKTLANHLINNSGQVVNLTELVNTFNIGTDKTVRNYLDYLSQSFLMIQLSKFSYKSTERLRNSKAYVVDTGMLTYRPDSLMSDNLGWRLENAVLLELLRRCSRTGMDVYYYRPTARSREVDFVVAERGEIRELIQVSYDVSSDRALSRELAGLLEASQKTGCNKLTLIANTETRKVIVENKEIAVISALDWLLQ